MFMHSVREDLSCAHQLSALFGWSDSIYSHLSARLNENTCLMAPFGLNFNEITSQNLLPINISEKRKSPPSSHSINPAGDLMHRSIYEKRKDIGAIIHLHTDVGVALSALKEGLLPLSQHACHFYGKLAYYDYTGVFLDKKEGLVLLSLLERAQVIVLRNHGYVVVGKNIAEAFIMTRLFEKAATIQLAAMATNRPLQFVPQSIEKSVDKDAQCIRNLRIEWEALKRLLPRRTHASHRKRSVA